MADQTNFHKVRNIWYGVVHRTTNPKNPSYKNYGGRGISLCESWKSFDNFYNDIGKDYKVGLTLERIDNSKGYFPENVRWANKKEQANNRRTSRYFVINGITKTFAEWIDFYGVKPSTAKQRFYVLKWTIEKSLGVE